MTPFEHELNTLTNNNENKQTQAYRQIKEAISRNEFPPGTVMVERKLCEIYNVSRSPIRNALQQLTFEGLLAYSPTKGIVVPEFKLEDILEVYDLIEVLQLYALPVCIQRLDSIAVGTLDLILEQMRKSIDENDLFENTKWDRKFHEFIIGRASNSRLESIFDQLINQQTRFVVTTFSDTQQAEHSFQEHLEIAESIKARDLSRSEAAIKSHYAAVKQYYINKLIKKF